MRKATRPCLCCSRRLKAHRSVKLCSKTCRDTLRDRRKYVRRLARNPHATVRQ